MKKTKRIYEVVLMLLITIILIGCSEPSKKAEFKVTGSSLPDTFLLGSHLCRFPMPPMKEMLSDMDNLKKHGFNLIKIQTHWAVDEPLE